MNVKISLFDLEETFTQNLIITTYLFCFQLAETESESLDLQDRIQALEQQLQNQNILPTVVEEEGTPEDVSEALIVKDQYILKIEKEKQDIQTESNKIVRITLGIN